MSETGLFTISELAKRSGTNAATIKHYVNEGLLTPVKKTGKTMAWYDEESVKRLELIRSLKEDRFLPLSVIKRLLRDGGLTDVSVELDHAIYPAPETGLEHRSYTIDELSRETGLSEEWLEALVDADLLHPAGEDNRVFSELDAKIAQIVKQREDDGLSLFYSREVLRQYSVAIERAVYRDIRLFVSMVLSDPEITDPLSLFNRDDDSINLFLFYARRKFNRRFVNETLGEIEEFIRRVGDWIVISPGELLAHAETHAPADFELDVLREIAALLEEATSQSEPESRPERASESQPDVPEPTAQAMRQRSAPLSHLAGVMRRVNEFSKSGAIDRRLHDLLSDLEAIENYGASPSEIISAYEGVFLEKLLAAWFTGAIYVALPATLGYRLRGMRILEGFMEALKERGRSQRVEAFVELLEHRVVPALRQGLADLRIGEEEDG